MPTMVRFVSLLALLALAGAGARADEPTRDASSLAVATFAGGCFWCMEPPFDALEGVVATISGYTGGHQANPTYEQVSAGGTGHVEAVQVRYDPARIGYEQLLDVYWRNIDPTDAGGQFCDRGHSYTTAIFFHNEHQQRLAQRSKEALERTRPFEAPVVTPIRPAGEFYPAEKYHQDYYLENPLRYKYYRFACGRDARLQALWGEGG